MSNAETHYTANASIADAYVANIRNTGVSNPPCSLGVCVKMTPRPLSRGWNHRGYAGVFFRSKVKVIPPDLPRSSQAA